MTTEENIELGSLQQKYQELGELQSDLVNHLNEIMQEKFQIADIFYKKTGNHVTNVMQKV